MCSTLARALCAVAKSIYFISPIYVRGGLLAMPWNEHYYPRTMQHLPTLVRAKAIEIANALLREGRDEGSAIRIAIARAKEWALHHGLPPEDAP